jgi:hypothetical protein
MSGLSLGLGLLGSVLWLGLGLGLGLLIIMINSTYELKHIN